MDENVEEGLVVVGRYASFLAANERALVVLSMDLAYRMMPVEGEFLLCVDAAQAEAVAEQLAKFEKESRNWPPRPPTITPRVHSNIGLWCYALVIIGMYIAQQVWPTLSSLGMNDAQAVFDKGEFWRCATALFLHGDVAHLVGNVVAGVCLIWLVVQVFGNRMGWLLVLLAGFFGNLLSAWLNYPEVYRSLGASTAIFGALGLLVGHALAVGFNPEGWQRLRSRLVPLAAGMTVLALTGAGGERTDVLAHVTGFAMGIALGTAVQWLMRKTGTAVK